MKKKKASIEQCVHILIYDTSILIYTFVQHIIAELNPEFILNLGRIFEMTINSGNHHRRFHDTQFCVY